MSRLQGAPKPWEKETSTVEENIVPEEGVEDMKDVEGMEIS